MKKTVFLLATCTLLGSAKLHCRDAISVAVVNFTTCVQESKFGKKEQQNFENLRKQMVSMIEESQKELQELSQKLEDPEYIDSLSPKAEEELKLKFQTKNQDIARIQNQYYQVLQQANMQVMQKLNDNVSKASEAVAIKKNLGVVINKEACFYYKPNIEVTNLVISEMDKNYEVEEKNQKLSENNEAKEQENQLSQSSLTPQTPDLLDKPVAFNDNKLVQKQSSKKNSK